MAHASKKHVGAGAQSKGSGAGGLTDISKEGIGDNDALSNRDKKHGMHAAEGQHAGDMPNLHVPQSGELTIEVLNAAITLEKGKPNSVFKPDGTSVIIHAGKDDYTSDPDGKGGGRFACGVIQ
jgi:Cu/Zn superoxide dismutase